MPVSPDYYVSLETKDPLDKDEVRHWFATVKATLPSGLPTTIQTHDDKGSLKSVALIVRSKGGTEAYTVPLTRNLTPNEGETLVAAYEAPRGLEIDISISSSYQDNVPDATTIKIDDSRYGDLCTNWAKSQHASWMKARLASGWRYGSNLDLAQKTHPMLKPWADLPASQRTIDFEAPGAMIQLLNDQGYVVVSKDEIAAVSNLIRQI